MTDRASLRVAGLLASRLCHDLIGPLGAVDNGLELIADEGGIAEEALALARRSAKRAAGRLRYLRYAFGAAGEDPGFGASEARGLAQNLLQGSEIQLGWPAPGNDLLPAGAGRLLLNMILLGMDCLPRGGQMQIVARSDLLAIDCKSPHARLTPELRSAILAGSPDDLTARTIVGYYAALLALELGGRLEAVAGTSDQIRLATPLRAAAPS